MKLFDWRKWIVHKSQAAAWPASAVALPRLQAHRGAPARGGSNCLENSLPAFRSARTADFVMSECDLRLTVDSVPVVCHDPDLERVWKKSGVIARLTRRELQSLAAVPTLAEILTASQVTPNWNLELKSRTASDPLVRLTVETVMAHQAQNRVLFSSFNPLALWLLQDYAPEIPRALLVSSERTQENVWWLRQMLLLPFLKIHMLNLQHSILDLPNGDINAALIEEIKNQGFRIAVWTVASSERAEKYLHAGVDSVITD